MSTNHGDNDGGDSLVPWYHNKVLLTLVIASPFIAVGLVYLYLLNYGWIPENRREDRTARPRQPVDDGHELVERRETFEGPRKSEESARTLCESEQPVETNAKLEV